MIKVKSIDRDLFIVGKSDLVGMRLASKRTFSAPTRAVSGLR